MTAIPTPSNTQASVIACLRYRDAPGAIDWLCATFDFARHLVVPGEPGQIVHAQLTFGNSMIMLGSASVENAYGRLVKQPDELGGAQTQTLYVIVPDADLLYQRACDAGAEIVLPIADQDYGGRGFTCRDLERHVWSFGTYNPW